MTAAGLLRVGRPLSGLHAPVAVRASGEEDAEPERWLLGLGDTAQPLLHAAASACPPPPRVPVAVSARV